MLNCEDIKLKIQALTDNELPEEEIAEVINHIENCYVCRNEYIELLKLQRKMKNIKVPEPPKEWFEDLPKKVFRRLSSVLGKILFFGSYGALIAYALYSFFSDSGESTFLKFIVGALFLGILVLLGVTIVDRFRESKTDKYKGVIK